MPDTINLAFKNKPVLSTNADPRSVAEYMLAMARWAGPCGGVIDQPPSKNTSG